MDQNTATSLTNFLWARITEDEEFWLSSTWEGPQGERRRRQMLADCDSKRWIVADLELTIPECGSRQPDGKEGLERVLQSMAMVYADHPEYREEWKV